MLIPPTFVEYWPVGKKVAQYLPMTLGNVSSHLAADWVPSLPPAVGTAFVGWPPYLLEANSVGNRSVLGLRSVARQSDRQWKGVLSWMLGVAGARHVLDSEGYRWIAPLSAFYPEAVQPVDLSMWNPQYPASRLIVTRAPGNHSKLRPDYIALRSTTGSSTGLDWALVEAKGTQRSLASLNVCPLDWRQQVYNASISIDHNPVLAPRHLVIATRVNPNAKKCPTRRLQLRAWNQEDKLVTPSLPPSSGIEIVAAHLFGLFCAVGLRMNAWEIAISTQLRRERVGYDPQNSKRLSIAEAADAELKSKMVDSEDQAGSARFTFETVFGTIEIEISKILLDLSKDLRVLESPEKAAEVLRTTDGKLDEWERARATAEPDERTITLRSGVVITFF